MSSSRARANAGRTRYIVGSVTGPRGGMARSYVAAADRVNPARLKWGGGARGWARMGCLAGPPPPPALPGAAIITRPPLPTPRGPAAAASGAAGRAAAAEVLPPVASDLTSTVLSLLEAGRAAVPALVVPDGPELSYRSLRQHVARVADTLASLGVARGDRVAIVLGNGPEAVVAILGAASAAAAAPLNPACTEDELRYYIEDVAARALILPRRRREAARRARRAGGRPSGRRPPAGGPPR